MVKKLTVAFCGVMPVDFHGNVKKGLRQLLDESPLSVSIIDCFTYSPSKESIRFRIEQAIEQEADALVTVGLLATQVAKEVVVQRGLHIPILYCGICDAVRYGIIHSYASSMKNGTIVGVETEPLVDILPAQMLKILKPTMRHLLIPHHPNFRNGTIRSDALKIREFLRPYRVRVTLLEVESIDECVAAVKKAITTLPDKPDSLIFLSGDLVYNAYLQLGEFCKEHNVTLFADGKEAVEKGAVFALAVDVEMIGRRLAELLLKIFSDNVHPCQLTTVVYPIQRQLMYNKEMLAQDGSLVLNKEAIEKAGILLDDQMSRLMDPSSSYPADVPVHYVTVITMMETALFHDIALNLVRQAREVASQVCLDIGTVEYLHRYTQTVPLLVEKVLQDEHSVIIACSREVKDALVTAMKARPEHEREMIIALISERLEPDYYAQIYEHVVDNVLTLPGDEGVFVRYGLIPAVDAKRRLDLAKLLFPQIKRIMVVQTTNGFSFESYKKELDAYSQAMGVAFEYVTGVDMHDLQKGFGKHIQNVDAVLCFEEYIGKEHGNILTELTRDAGKIMLAPGIDESRKHAAIASGTDAGQMAYLLASEHLLTHLHEGIVKDLIDHLLFEKRQRHRIREALCKEHGFVPEANPGLQVILSESDLYHAADEGETAVSQ